MRIRAAASSRCTVANYYADPTVRARILEYCGGTHTPQPSAAYLALLYDDGAEYLTWERALRVPVDVGLDLLHLCPDVARSLWDTRDLIFVLDVDHQCIDAPGESFADPVATFLRLEGAYHATRKVLARFRLPASRLMTGRGYHFTGRIPLEHEATDLLASLVPETPAWYDGLEARRPAGITASMSQRQARAAAGLGLLTEYLAHLVLRRTSPISRIPVVVNGTVVGHSPFAREGVSLDFSHAGDPLDVRMIRTAFSAYQWHRLRPDIFGAVAVQAGPFAAVPRTRQSLHGTLANRSLRASRRLAQGSTAVMPDVSAGIGRLVASYQTSRLARFHRRFAEQRRQGGHPPLDVTSLPPCATTTLMTPNDLLLKPEHLQHLTRVLLARGWTPGEIASLVRSYYEGDHGWGDRWTRIHPGTRAEFDVRVFAGLVETGTDRMVDFNCVSAQEKGLCPGVGCPFDLRVDRAGLRARVTG